MGIVKEFFAIFKDAVDIGREFEAAVFPTLEEEADITVYMNPGASRVDGYFLAIGTAFGFIKNRDLTGKLLPNGFIGIEYHAEQNMVRFVCRQESTWKGTLQSLSKPASVGGSRPLALFNGPPEETVGGDWQWYNPGINGIPRKGGVGAFARWKDRVILAPTATYVDVGDGNKRKLAKSPTPPGDHHSRGQAGPAGSAEVKTLDPKYQLTHPHYLLFNALLGPCDAGAKLTTADLKVGFPIPTSLTASAAPTTPEKVPTEAGITAVASANPTSLLGPPQSVT